MKVFEAKLDGKGLKIAIVVSRFNSFISEQLLLGAIDGLKRHNVSEDHIDIYKVPGSFEIPLMCKKLVQKNYDAVIALGAVIRGNTPHFDYVAAEVSKGVAQVSLESGKPVIFGVLTTDSIEQAIERAGTKAGNKGYDAAVAAIEMGRLISDLK